MGEMLGMFTLRNTSAAQKWNRNNMMSGLKLHICWILPKTNRGIQELASYGAFGAKHLHVRQKTHLKSRAGIETQELPRVTGLYKPTYLGRVEKSDTVSEPESDPREEIGCTILYSNKTKVWPGRPRNHKTTK